MSDRMSGVADRVHSCSDRIDLHDEPVPGRVLIAALVSAVGAIVGLWAWWGFVAGGVVGAVLLALVVILYVLQATDTQLWRQQQDGLIAQVRTLVRLRRTRTAKFAASLCPHGVQLRRPGAEPVLLPWSKVRQIGVLHRFRGPIVGATLARGADPIGMPAAGRIVSGVPDDPELRWLGRVPRGLADEVRARIDSWRQSASTVASLRFYRDESNLAPVRHRRRPPHAGPGRVTDV